MKDYLSCAKMAAQFAGEKLSSRFSDHFPSFLKSPGQLLTEADLLAEKEIIQIIKANYPSHRIFSEEAGEIPGNSPFTWYVDPLDGTTNYVTGNSYFSVSIALACEGEIIVGVVYNPITGEMYSAVRGWGAFLNDDRIQIRNTCRVSEAVVATDVGVCQERAGSLSIVALLRRECRAIVVNRAPALDLCNIARGRLDALVDDGSRVVDHAAGSLVLTEAKGWIRNFSRDSWSAEVKGVIASVPPLSESLMSLLQLSG
ncbi:inositol monophosphatase family protein [Amycolatopsis sp. NPDC003731]